MAIFLKINVVLIYFRTSGCILAKIAIIFSHFFGKNILKISIGPTGVFAVSPNCSSAAFAEVADVFVVSARELGT
jgi:membrane-associated phospholipid phosphatase